MSTFPEHEADLIDPHPEVLPGPLLFDDYEPGVSEDRHVMGHHLRRHPHEVGHLAEGHVAGGEPEDLPAG